MSQGSYKLAAKQKLRVRKEYFGRFVMIVMALCLFIQPAKVFAKTLIRFDIPAGFASATLKLYAEQSDRQVLFPYDQMSRKKTNPVSGVYKADEALDILLRNTGLTVFSNKKGILTISSLELTEEVLNMKINRKKRFWGSLTAIAALFASNNVSAQDENGSWLEEVVVTATKRAENLQDVPVSITAFSGDALEDARLSSLQDIARFTPGFTSSDFSNSSPIFAVRGANNTFSQAGASKPVGVFIDDVFIPRNSAANFDLFDLEQVAVLRGPQGTLFGRNVTGGAVQITTAKASLEDSESKLKIGTGNLGYFEAAAYGNTPFSDKAAGKASFSYKQRDGYITDRFTGQDLNDIESLSLRGQLLYKASDDVEVILSADYTKDDNNGRGLTLVSGPAAPGGTNFPGGVDRSDSDGDIRTSEANFPQDYERDIFGASLRVNWDVSAGKLSSITAYRESETREIYSFGAGNVALSSVRNQFIKDEGDEPTMFSQELRFVSNKGDKFDYVAGFYYYNEDTDRQLNDIILLAPQFKLFDRFYDVNAKTDSYAVYADATIHLSETVDLSFGGRYTDEEKDVSVNFDSRPGLLSQSDFAISANNGFDEFTSRVALNWAATDNINLYASRTEGFTAGGFNTETNSVAAISLGFEPETITAYEIGAKTQWLDNQLTLNVTGFSQDFENKQEGFFNVTERFFSIFNASEASMDGFEVEAIWIPADGLTFNLSYSDLDAEYDSFVIPGTGADLSGNKLQTSPEKTFSLGFNYRRPLSSGGDLLLNANYSWQDEYFTGAQNFPTFLIDSYGLANASIGYETGDGKWGVSLWGKNIGDEEYVLVRASDTGAIGEYYGAPRTYGATVKLNF